MSLLDLVQQHLGPSEIQQISGQIGADPASTQRAVQAAVPLMLGGLAQHAQSPQGAGTIQQAAAQHAGVLDRLGSLAGAAPVADAGSGLLDRVLGGHQSTVQQGVQQASGLTPDQTRRLLMVLAPIVLAMLARRHANAQQANAQQANAQQANPTELGGTLQQEAQAAQQQVQQESPHVGGLLGQLLNMVQSPRR